MTKGTGITTAHHAVVTSAARLAIFATVARLHPVAAWIVDHEAPERSMAAMPSLRATFSARPLYFPAALAFAWP